MPLTKAEISRLRSLQDKKHRESLGFFVVEGEKVVGELLAAHFPFTEIFATAEWVSSVGKVNSPRPKTIEVSSTEMARISHFPTPSHVLAVGRISRASLDPLTLNHGLTLALDGIQDPGNVGTLLRIADWFAFDRVVLSPDCADLFSQKVINASMGSFARVQTFTAPLTEALRGTTAPVLGCDLQGKDVHALKPLHDAIVVLGSEGRGISEGVKQLVTYYVTIPCYGATSGRLGGGAESLNAAVAAAVVCDNLRRVSGK